MRTVKRPKSATNTTRPQPKPATQDTSASTVAIVQPKLGLVQDGNGLLSMLHEALCL